MMQCLATVLIVLFGLVIFSHAKENKCPEGKACPIQNAVCCGKSAHCCPDRYTYDVIKGICKMGRKLVPLLRKFPAKPIMNKTVLASKTKGETISPDGFQCPDSQTRCRLSFGPYACCPLPQAVCCSDKSYCCPNGHTCAAAARECIEGFRTNAVLQKISALKTTMPTARSPICPDKRHRCPEGQTCCRVQRWKYQCCPLPNAYCCPGGLLCCPHGFVCSLLLHRCLPIQSRSAIFQKLTPTKKGPLDMTSYGIKKSLVAELKYIHCPDASSCFDYETCCELADGQYGCCPSSKAVCCSDHEHYCPAGFRCDLTAQMCVTENARLPILKKAKSPLRPKTQQVKLDEKIYFCPVRAHVGDPVTNDD